MNHKIPIDKITRHTKGISDSKRNQVSNLQKHIQEILGDTHHTFLQGSYKNDTSTSDINDVDIVAVRLTTYSSVHTSFVFSSSIPWDTIFTEIENKLRDQKLYQWTVTRKDKCIEVKTSSFKADVVPAVQVHADHKEDPIAIYSFSKGFEKVNYPRTHYQNGVKKQEATKGNYKPLVRMFKNWAANHFGNNDIASSYHIESLVYNVPDDKFFDDHASTFVLVADHITGLLTRRDALHFEIKSVCGSEDITNNWEMSARQHFNNRLKQSVSHGLNAHKAVTVEEAERHWDNTFNL